MKNMSMDNGFIKSAAVIFLISCAIGISVAVACTFSGHRVEDKTGEAPGIRERNREGNDERPEQSEKTEMSETSETPETSEMSEIPYALESFGRYLEELYREGRRTELDSLVISRRLSLKEAALMAEGSPLLEHIRSYEENELTIATGGICIIAADVNGDGLEDLIEYGPDAENADTANMLNIYLGKEDGGFGLSYSQPLFSMKVKWSDIIEVVRYGEETFLLFRDRVRGALDDWKEEGVLAAYQFSDGKPMGKLNLDYVCSDISMTITENADAWDIGFLTENRLSLYHVANYRHCDVQYDWPDRYGSGETEINRWEDEETYEAYEVLLDGYVKKYMALQEPYVKGWEEDPQEHYHITNISDMYESDLNNDGVTERYLKAVKELWMYETGFPSIGYGGQGLPHITGEYYGIHEGRYGLMYYIESEGEETDFLKMCGLDIWAGEMTPQYFWVEQTDRGNVTYITYQDGDEHRQRIEGYLIQGDAYERVVSAEYIPEIECHVSYKDMGEESDGVDYIVHRAKDMRSFELEWEEENEREESINRNIRALLEEKMGALVFLEGEAWERMTVRYHPIEATREQFIVDCMIFFNNPRHTPAMDHTPDFRVLINLVTGECREIDESAGAF